MPGNGVAAGASYGDLLVTSLIVLGVVCVLAFVAVRVLGRLLSTRGTRGAQLMTVVSRVGLEPRRSLYVVEVAGKTLLVGTSEMGLSVLSELDGKEVEARKVVQPSFGELVRGAWMKRKGVAAANARSDEVDPLRARGGTGDVSDARTATAKDGTARDHAIVAASEKTVAAAEQRAE